MIDEEVVTDRLRHIDRYTDELARMSEFSKERYLDDFVLQRAVERSLMNLIQACIDLAAHIRSAEDLSPDGTARQDIEALGDAAVITEETQAKLEEVVGFRNVLAHRYASIDHEIVYRVLHEDLPWFERFQREVARWYRAEFSS